MRAPRRRVHPPGASQPATPSPAPSGQKSGGRAAATQRHAACRAEQHRLPPDSTTRQTLALPGRTLDFTATAGSIRLFDGKGEPQADIAYTSYQLDGADRARRPVTFLFNGGPGASSAWLQFGDAGPWRLSISGEGAVSSATPDLLPNAETWLDFTDLVFIDPVGTGYSRFVASGDDVRKRFFSVDGDVSAIALVIRRWLEKYDRLLSPKFVTGESYGGIRGPKIVRNLQTQQGVGVRGLIMVSPLFDFATFPAPASCNTCTAADAWRRWRAKPREPVTRADLADVERYAQGEFLADLLKGQADKEATTRLADKVAALTGIDQAVSRRLAGRFECQRIPPGIRPPQRPVTGRYDASVLGFDPYPDSSSSHFGDPSGDSADGAADQRGGRSHHAQTQLAARWLVSPAQRGREQSLGFRPRARPSRFHQLRQILALDPKLKLLVGHGLFDLATPYFGVQDHSRPVAGLCATRTG